MEIVDPCSDKTSPNKHRTSPKNHIFELLNNVGIVLVCYHAKCYAISLYGLQYNFIYQYFITS